MKQVAKLFFLVLFAFLFTACMEKKTEDPIKTYKFCTGEKPPKEIEVVRGKYWESSRWSKEYIMYLELKAPADWRNEFIRQNNFVNSKGNSNIPADAPFWFKPAVNFKAWIPSGFTQGSTYYEDTLSRKMFIYEIQL